MKEEFEDIIGWTTEGKVKDWMGNILVDVGEVWEWVEKKLLESYQRGFENGVKWQKLEDKEEE